MSQSEDTLRQDPDLMQQNIKQAEIQSTNENQDVLSFPHANPNGGPSHGGNACISGLYGANNPNQYDITGQSFFPEAHASDPKVFNSHGAGYFCPPPVNNTANFAGAVTSTHPNPSIMMAACNGPGLQGSQQPIGFNSYQGGTNGQGTFALDLEQEGVNFQASFPFNSNQAGPSGHISPVFDAHQSGPNGHKPRAVNSDQGDNTNSQGRIVSNHYQADPEGQGSLILNSDQTSPNSQGYIPPNPDQAGSSMEDQIASIFDLSQTHVLDNPTLWKPITVEDIARNPAATFQYFINFQNSLQSSHELALDKVQNNYAIAVEKVRNDYAIAHEKIRNSYAVALQQAHYNLEAYYCRLRADLDYLRSDNAAKTQTIRDFRNFLENLNREMSNRGLRLSPTSIPSTPITQTPAAAGGQMGPQPSVGGQTGTVATNNEHPAEVMNTPGQGHAVQAPAAAGRPMGAQPNTNGQPGMVVPRNGQAAGLINTQGPGHSAHESAAVDGPLMLVQSNGGNSGGPTMIRFGNGARQSNTPGQPQVSSRPQTQVPPPPQGAPRPLLPGPLLVTPGPSLAIRYAASQSPTNDRHKRTLSEMSSAAPGKKKLARLEKSLIAEEAR